MLVFICLQIKFMDCFLHLHHLAIQSLRGNMMLSYKTCFLLASRSFPLYKIITVGNWTVTHRTLFENSRSRKTKFFSNSGEMSPPTSSAVQSCWNGSTVSFFIQGPLKVPIGYHPDPSARLSGAQKQYGAKQRHGTSDWCHISGPASFY